MWTFAGILVVAITGLLTEMAKTRRKIDQVHEDVGVAANAAVDAADLARPTGNGFAQSVKDSLARIEKSQQATDDRLAAFDIRVTRRLDRAEDRLDKHIDES